METEKPKGHAVVLSREVTALVDAARSELSKELAIKVSRTAMVERLLREHLAPR